MVAIKLSWIFKTLPLFLISLSLCQDRLNITEYKRMPALYNYDNYYDCLNRDQADAKYPAKYCMVFVQIQPNNVSSVWQQMESMMTDKFSYRHDNLLRGVCMERCNDLMENNATTSNFKDQMLENEITKMYQRFYNTPLDRIMRYDYQQEIHECVNREYMSNYNLSTKTFTKFCIDPQQSREKDIYFSTTIFLIILLVLLNILSTIYDAILKSKYLKPRDTKNYYEVKHSGKANRFLTAFSIYRNYKRLVIPNTSDIGCDLSFLDGFRSLICLLIVAEHIFLGQLIVHLDNTEFTENIWHQPVPRLLLHSIIFLELFFVLSGLLLYVKFEKFQYITPKSSFQDCVHVFVRLLFSRYLRYLPSLLFVIAYTANIVYYNGNSSLGRSFLDPNCLECRDTWWLNILMVNNYFMDMSCLMITWYGAAEFHLYGLFLILLIVIAKYPQSRVFLLSSVAVLAAAINFGLNYILKLDSAFLVSPESFRYFPFSKIETGKYLYFSSYTNINSFLLGIVCGFIYMKYLRKNPKNKKQLRNILQMSPYIGWMAILAILYLGTTIMSHQETTIWTAAYGLLHRHVGLTIIVVIVILRGMCTGGGFLNHAAFRLLSRISFQVYLWQMIVFFHILPYMNEPLHMNLPLLFIIIVVIYIFLNLIAFLAALLMEYPIAEVIATIDIEKKLREMTVSRTKRKSPHK